jgi:hypothetical protein
MTCTEIRDLLDDYLDAALGARERAELESHLGRCEGCRDEERRLRALLAEAAALPPELTPRRDLWDGIERRIRAGNLAPFARAPRRMPSVTSLAAAAAVLMALSSAATFMLVRQPSEAWLADAPRVSLRPASAAAPAGLVEAERQYERAAAELLALIEARRDSLSPETLAVVEKNVQTIDEALASLRSAVADDPGNRELTMLLATTHKRKLDTLRRVVRLTRIS